MVILRSLVLLFMNEQRKLIFVEKGDNVIPELPFDSQLPIDNQRIDQLRKLSTDCAFKFKII